MSAKTPRRTFAAPLVVTLALPVAGACIVTSGKAPPPSRTGTTDHRTGGGSGDSGNPPATHVNPPRTNPGRDAAADPNTSTSTTVQQTNPAQPTQQANLRTWHVWRNESDKSCYATQKVDCPPKPATCNPPPPAKLASCPSGLEMPQGLTIREDAADSCAVYYPMPECPAGMSCNPPRPQTIACPKY